MANKWGVATPLPQLWLELEDFLENACIQIDEMRARNNLFLYVVSLYGRNYKKKLK